MTARQQWLVVGLIVALLCAAAMTAMHFLGDELTSLDIGDKAPPFVAVTVADNPGVAQTAKTLSDYRGEVVLLNIWATFCEPCRVEMPSIEALKKNMGPKGLKVVAVSVDNPGDERLIRSFVKQYNLSFEILHDSTRAIMTTYHATGYPETFVIARDGTIRKKHIGPDDWNSVDNLRLFESLLAEKRP